ncbi:hypothetical protein ACQKWADRAFT_36258 [Trichoderma austrokoningii]
MVFGVFAVFFLHPPSLCAFFFSFSLFFFFASSSFLSLFSSLIRVFNIQKKKTIYATVPWLFVSSITAKSVLLVFALESGMTVARDETDRRTDTIERMGARENGAEVEGWDRVRMGVAV